VRGKEIVEREWIANADEQFFKETWDAERKRKLSGSSYAVSM